MASSLWEGSIRLGRLKIPVLMYPVLRERAVHFHRMSPDGQSRLRTQLVSPESGEIFDLKDTARGFEIADGQYVIVDDEEMEAIAPEASHTIDLEDFVALHEIEPVYFDKPYALSPGVGGQRSYRSLVEALQRSQKVGIGRFVLRTRQHLAALRPGLGGLVLSTLRYADEIELPAEVVHSGPTSEKGEVEKLQELIGSMTVPFEASRYRDTVRERLTELIERKAEGAHRRSIDPESDPFVPGAAAPNRR